MDQKEQEKFNQASTQIMNTELDPNKLEQLKENRNI